MTRKLAIALLMACTASTLGIAGPFYVGGSYGNTTLQADVSNIDFDADDPGWKVFAGFRFLRFLGVEGGYVDLGSPSDGNISVDLKGWDVAGMGILGLGPVDIFAKYGAFRWDSDVTNAGSDSGTDQVYGVGLGFHFGHIGIRGEYEKFDVDNTDDLYMVSVGFEWRFQ
jgi:hypothetical protein